MTSEAEMHRINSVFTDVGEELGRAMTSFPAMRSAHEGYAVLYEEIDELWQEVKLKQTARDAAKMRHEAVQVAAMAIRFAIDVCTEQGVRQ